jgi:hypothetical protein
MSKSKLNVFICLLHCKMESCHNVSNRQMNTFSLDCDMILSYLQCNRQINTFSLACDMTLSYNVIDK